MDSERIVGIVFMLSMVSGVIVILMAMGQRSKRLEMLHRERMAMIERGQVPPAGETPYGGVVSPRGSSSRSMSIGIVLIGFGLALMSVVGIAGESPEVGVGVGGAFAVLGAAFIANSFVSKTAVSHPPHPPLPPPSTQPPDPPQ